MPRKRDYTTADYNKAFPQRLRDVMQSKGMSQKDLAEALGKTRQAVGYYQDGSSKPDWEVVAKIATTLGVSSDYLLGLTKDPHCRPAASDELGLSVQSVENIRLLQQLQERGSSVSLNVALDALLSNKDRLLPLLQSVARMMDKWMVADDQNILLDEQMEKECERMRAIFGNSVTVAFGDAADYLNSAVCGMLFNALLVDVQKTIAEAIIAEGKLAQAYWAGIKREYPDKAEAAEAAARLAAQLQYTEKKFAFDSANK